MRDKLTDPGEWLSATSAVYAATALAITAAVLGNAHSLARHPSPPYDTKSSALWKEHRSILKWLFWFTLIALFFILMLYTNGLDWEYLKS